MTTYNPLLKPASVGSLMLANFAVFWGFVVAPIYVVGFGLLLPYALDGGGVAGPASTLPKDPCARA